MPGLCPVAAVDWSRTGVTREDKSGTTSRELADFRPPVPLMTPGRQTAAKYELHTLTGTCMVLKICKLILFSFCYQQFSQDLAIKSCLTGVLNRV